MVAEHNMNQIYKCVLGIMPNETSWYTLVCLAHFLLDMYKGSLNPKGLQIEVYPIWHYARLGHCRRTSHKAE